ncbi:MAG: hypothetical protein WC812_01000 [Candidatus Pacearchaeota archaeon]|jgi:hypothetical protein
MGREINIGPYIAERLIFFKKGRNLLDTIQDEIPDAGRFGKVNIYDLEFKIKTIDREFIVDVGPLKKEDWYLLEEHISRLKDNSFWESDNKLMDFKKCIDNNSSFVSNKKEEIINKNKLRISGVFYNFNEKFSYDYVLNCIVKPLGLYKNFPRKILSNSK